MDRRTLDSCPELRSGSYDGPDRGASRERRANFRSVVLGTTTFFIAVALGLGGCPSRSEPPLSDAGPRDGMASCTSDDDCDDGDDCNGAETCSGGSCRDGTALTDGDECDADGMASTRDVCVESACAPTRCGDGFVDEGGGEACDDGNDVAGDGCDDCAFSCEAAADCDDGESCNGAETCSTDHTCEAGTALANGTDCAGGTGRCLSGGCLPNDCTADSDCVDGNACNGDETCQATGCAPGTAPSCDDGDACTADSCVAPGGCQAVFIDMDNDGHAPTSAGACGTDCDDTRADTHPDAPEICGNARDEDCDGMTDEVDATAWFADCDGDGFAAASARMITACAMPAPGLAMCATGGGWTARDPSSASTRDCNDGNASVNPAQTMFQTTAISGATAATDYDYDCDTTEEPRSAAIGTCSGTGCALSEGWSGSVPACGASGTWVTGCMRGLLSCTPVTESRQQACL